MRHKHKFKKGYRMIAGKKRLVDILICDTDDCPNVRAHKKLI